MKGPLHMLLALLAVTAASSAFGQATIASVASGIPDLSTLVAAVTACPSVLAAASDNTTAVTVFAPTNEAFNTALAALNITAGALLNDTSLLCSILAYHIVPAVVPSTAATAEPTSLPTLLGPNVTVVLINGTVYVNNATVTSADIPAGLSVIHIINQVLTPPAAPSSPIESSPVEASPSPVQSSPVGTSNVTLASVVAGIPALTTLLAAVKACPPILAAATNPATAVTLFAPTNEAFASLFALNNVDPEAFLNDTSSLCAVLQLHVVPSVIPASAATATPLSVGSSLPGVNLTIQLVNGTVEVNNANVTVADIPAGLSVVHIINEVLEVSAPTNPSPVETPSPASVPSPVENTSPVPTPVPTPLPTPVGTPADTIASVAAVNPDLSTFLAAVSVCPDLLAAASTPSTNVTVFAPTNDAFAAFLNASNLTATELLASPALLCPVLAFHVVPGALPASAVTSLTTTLTTLTGADTYIQLINGTLVYVNNAQVVVPDVYAGASIIHVIDAVLDTTQTLAAAAGAFPQINVTLEFILSYQQFLDIAVDPSTNITLFVPTNEALTNGLEKISAELAVSITEIAADTEFVKELLYYHAVAGQFNTSSLVGDDVVRLPTLLPKAHLSVRNYKDIVLVNQYTRIVLNDEYAGNSIIQIVNKLLLPTNWESYFNGVSTTAARRKMLRTNRKFL